MDPQEIARLQAEFAQELCRTTGSVPKVSKKVSEKDAFLFFWEVDPENTVLDSFGDFIAEFMHRVKKSPECDTVTGITLEIWDRRIIALDNRDGEFFCREEEVLGQLGVPSMEAAKRRIYEQGLEYEDWQNTSYLGEFAQRLAQRYFQAVAAAGLPMIPVCVTPRGNQRAQRIFTRPVDA